MCGRAVVEGVRRKAEIEGERAGKRRQERRRQPAAPVGPAVAGLGGMEAVRERLAAVTDLQRQIGVAHHETLDRDPKPAPVARTGGDFRRDRAARAEP